MQCHSPRENTKQLWHLCVYIYIYIYIYIYKHIFDATQKQEGALNL